MQCSLITITLNYTKKLISKSRLPTLNTKMMRISVQAIRLYRDTNIYPVDFRKISNAMLKSNTYSIQCQEPSIYTKGRIKASEPMSIMEPSSSWWMSCICKNLPIVRGIILTINTPPTDQKVKVRLNMTYDIVN